MAALTPFACIVVFLYNGVAITTLILFLIRNQYSWVGLLVMAALVLLSMLEMFVWQLVLNRDSIIRYIRSRESESVREVFKDTMKWALESTLLVGLGTAIFGLVAIPMGIWQKLPERPRGLT